MAKRTAADQFVEILLAAGVQRLDGVVGESLNPVVDAIRRHDGIGWVQVGHEEAGAFAAGAEGQLTGRLVAWAGSCGPGNLHLISGLYDAHRSMARCWRWPPSSPAARSAPATSRRPIPPCRSRSAATTWSPCLGMWPTRRPAGPSWSIPTGLDQRPAARPFDAARFYRRLLPAFARTAEAVEHLDARRIDGTADTAGAVLTEQVNEEEMP
jgi:Thiamine pyrophosphate enzyme, N-terminal TPP binding domain